MKVGMRVGIWSGNGNGNSLGICGKLYFTLRRVRAIAMTTHILTAFTSALPQLTNFEYKLVCNVNILREMIMKVIYLNNKKSHDYYLHSSSPIILLLANWLRKMKFCTVVSSCCRQGIRKNFTKYP